MGAAGTATAGATPQNGLLRQVRDDAGDQGESGDCQSGDVAVAGYGGPGEAEGAAQDGGEE